MNSTGYNGVEYKTTEAVARQPRELQRTALGAFVVQSYGASNNNLYVAYLDNKFALLYFCYEVGVMKTDLAWILSRERFPDPRVYPTLERTLMNKGVILPLFDVNHIDCAVPNDKTQDSNGAVAETERDLDIKRERDRLFRECLNQFSNGDSTYMLYCYRNYHD